VQRTGPVSTRGAIVAGATMIGTMTTVLGLLVLWRLQAEGIWVALFLVPILLLATGPALSRQAAREGDRTLFWLLLAALTLKLLGSLVRYYVADTVYEGLIDAQGYHETAAMIAERFQAGNFDTGLESLTGTAFVPFLTGLLYTLIGPSIYAGFLLFSWIAFWGLFYLYRAFTIAIPEGNRRRYAHLLFFLPSILYWPSAIGKDAWMLFTLGVAAYGMARALTGRLWRGLAVASLGLYGAAVVRPHVAGMAGLGFAVAYILGRSPRRQGRRAVALKIVASVILVVLSVQLLSQTTEFLKNSGLEPEDGVGSVLAETSRRTNEGGSSFATSSSITPLSLPVGVVTILFRPFLFEAHNAQAAVTALESTLFLCLLVARRRAVWHAIRHLRRRPYVAFILVYSVLFVVAFSSIANFGILARERTQLLPFFLVLLALPAPQPRQRPAAPRSGEGRVDADRQLART
jgi:hypothetical protein